MNGRVEEVAKRGEAGVVFLAPVAEYPFRYGAMVSMAAFIL